MSGIDALNIIVHESDVKDREAELTAEIEKVIKPNRLAVTHDIAMIAIVGRELGTSPAIAVKVLGALANRKININLIDHGSEKNQHAHRRLRRRLYPGDSGHLHRVYEHIATEENVSYGKQRLFSITF